MCRIVCSIFIMALFLSCTPAAKTRYERVKRDLVEYYDEIGETEKVAAAEYLLSGAYRHGYYGGGAIDIYREKIMSLDIPCRKDSLTRAWEMACDLSQEEVVRICDTAFLDTAFLRENIDAAFAACSRSFLRLQ